MTKTELEKELKKGYEELGRVFFEDHKNDTTTNSKYEALFKNIKPFYAEYAAIEATELAEKGLKKCPSCGNTPPMVSLFCNMCGHKFESNLPKPEPAPVIQPKQPQLCPVCHNELEEDSLFCSNCGHHL